jgi:hypothetical protein
MRSVSGIMRGAYYRIAGKCKMRAWSFDRKLESWKAGCMKLTLDLPEDMINTLKSLAILEGRTFKNFMEEIFRRGLHVLKEEEAAQQIKPEKTHEDHD